jgi:hypothetical protein
MIPNDSSPSRSDARAWALPVLLVLSLTAAAVMAVLWRDAVSENRRLAEQIAEQARDAERNRMKAERERDVAVAARAEAEQMQDAAEVARNKVAQIEYARAIQLAHQALRDEEINRARELLDHATPERRGWEWFFLRRAGEPSIPQAKD